MRSLPRLRLSSERSQQSNAKPKGFDLLYAGSKTYRDQQRYQSVGIPKVIKSLNQSKEMPSLALTDRAGIVPPIRVKDRSEWNSNIYLLQKRKTRKKYKPISTYLKIPFPVHNIVDHVGQHGKGFKNKSNIDLFKHYYRMYLKNKWLVQLIKKQAKKDRPVLRVIGDRRGDVLISQAEANSNTICSIQEISFHLSPFASHANTPEDHEPELPVAVKEFIVDKFLDDMEMYRQLIKYYEQNSNPVSLVATRTKLQQQSDLKTSITHKVFYQTMQLKTNLMEQIDPLPRLYQLEETFISRIMDLVCSRGVDSLSYFDYMTFKQIVEERLQGLQQLKDGTVLEQLLKVKANYSKLSLHERKKQEVHQLVTWMKTQQLKTQTSKQSLIRYSTHYDTFPQPMVEAPIPQSTVNNISISEEQVKSKISPYSTVTSSLPQNNSLWSTGFKGDSSSADELMQAARAIDMESQLLKLLSQEPSNETQEKLLAMVEQIMSHQQLNRPQAILIESQREDPSEVKGVTPIGTSKEQNQKLEDISLDPIVLEPQTQQVSIEASPKSSIRQTLSLQHLGFGFDTISQSPQLVRVRQESIHSNEQSFVMTPRRGGGGLAPTQPGKHGSVFQTFAKAVEKDPRFELNAQKMNIQVHKQQDDEADEQLQFLKKLLSGHKKANQKLFSKIANNEQIVDEEQQALQKKEQEEADEQVTQFFRTERMLQHRFKKSDQTGQAKIQVDTSQEKMERRKAGQSRYNKLDMQLVDDSQEQSNRFSHEESSKSQLDNPSQSPKSSKNRTQQLFGNLKKQFKASIPFRKLGGQKIQNEDKGSSPSINLINDIIPDSETNIGDGEQQPSNKGIETKQKTSTVSQRVIQLKKQQQQFSQRKVSLLKKIAEESEQRQQMQNDLAEMHQRVSKGDLSKDQSSIEESISHENYMNEKLTRVKSPKREKMEQRIRAVPRAPPPKIIKIDQDDSKSQRSDQSETSIPKVKKSSKHSTKIMTNQYESMSPDRYRTSKRNTKPLVQFVKVKKSRRKDAPDRDDDQEEIDNESNDQNNSISESVQSSNQSIDSFDVERKQKKKKKSKSSKLQTGAEDTPTPNLRKKKRKKKQQGEENSIDLSQGSSSSPTRRSRQIKQVGQINEEDDAVLEMRNLNKEPRSTSKRNSQLLKMNKNQKSRQSVMTSKQPVPTAQQIEELERTLKEREALKVQQRQLTSLKDELARFMSQAWNIGFIKEHIDQAIAQLEQNGLIDEEIKYNIYLCKLFQFIKDRERQKQVQSVQTQAADFRESLFLGQDCNETVQQLFKQKFKFKESDDRSLKFMDNIGYLNSEAQMETLKQMNIDVNIYASSQWLKQDFIQRREIFLQDTELLKKLVTLQREQRFLQGPLDEPSQMPSQQLIELSSHKEVTFEDEIRSSYSPVKSLGRSDRSASHVPSQPKQSLSNETMLRKMALQRLRLFYKNQPEKWKQANDRKRGQTVNEEYAYIQKYLPHLLEFKKRPPFTDTTLRMADKVFEQIQK